MDETQKELPLPFPEFSGDLPLLPTRMLNEFQYCPRLSYLEWVQGEWVESADTVEGDLIRTVTGLQWTQVDLGKRMAWIHPDQAKARKAIAVPLNAEAVVLIRRQIGKHATQVFSYRAQHVTQVSTKAWYAAQGRAGIEDFRWHDLQHTWASWHMQQGTPSHVLQELGGWESAEMVRRYAHLNAEHLAPYADRLWTLEVVDAPIVGTNWSQA